MRWHSKNTKFGKESHPFVFIKYLEKHHSNKTDLIISIISSP